MNKRKIINDPLYGFITIHSDLIYDIIQHPYFQRLRRIKQLGLTDLVYPGANHTRFHHAIGAMHLMSQALDSLKLKGYEITNKEYESALIAILLHDIGHGPFSHVLESSILTKVHHEELSLLFMNVLNDIFNKELTLAISIFTGDYERNFFHDLVSSQLDMDRLDYLNRDSFFTGVSEGIVGSDRLVRMFEIVNDELVIEEKAIYSVENFLNARRMMYWQVYLHKTTTSAEVMLIQIVKRAKFLVKNGFSLPMSDGLSLFFANDFKLIDFKEHIELLEIFGNLDDYDLWGGIKQWKNCNDKILSFLCKSLLERNLFKVVLSKKPFSEEYVHTIEQKISQFYQLSTPELDYFRIVGEISNLGYISSGKGINIKKKNGEIIDITYASDLPNIKAMSEIVTKHFLCSTENVFLGFFK
ncbi:MAG: HD domain-containing protein [Cytophagales bacterium]|nr:MAG: HD domain-containing protein [Cytophagales bacterium]